MVNWIYLAYDWSKKSAFVNTVMKTVSKQLGHFLD